MSTKNYFGTLILLSGILGLVIWLLNNHLLANSHLAFGIICLFVFIVQCTMIFFLGERFAKSSNKNMFSQIIIANNGIKLLLSVIMIMGYIQMSQPDNKLFLIPFLVIYIVFTIFEAYFMMKQAKLKSND